MNFNSCKDLSDFKGLYDLYKGTNINFLMDSFAAGEAGWSVSPKASPGDTIIFMCAKTAKDKLGMVTSHIPTEYDDEFRVFIDQQKILYKKYSGHILGFGVVASTPEKDGSWWMADIIQLRKLTNPIYIDEFRGFITISKTGSITHISADQWERLRWVVNQKNPGFFENVIAPEAKVLECEHQEAVRKEAAKPLDKLKKEAEKKSKPSYFSMARTKVYHRDATIAAYVKKRANGQCQLCGMSAPFIDQYGEPYLECHHIEWLSKNGEDSIDNCVALCPNCHRKMHVLNDQEDIDILKKVIL